jgi:hypothetical protein
VVLQFFGAKIKQARSDRLAKKLEASKVLLSKLAMTPCLINLKY